MRPRPFLRLAWTVMLLALPACCAEEAKDGAARMGKVAESKRSAMLRLMFDDGAGGWDVMVGFFVSDDGWAHVPLGALCGNRVPARYELLDGTALDAPDLLHVSPQLLSAWVKFGSRPAAWIEPDERPVADMAPVVVVTTEPGLRPVAGQVMARVPVLDNQLKRPEYRTMLSIGAGMSPRDVPRLGAPVIDADGRLRGVIRLTPRDPVQRFLYAEPPEALAKQFEQARRAREKIPQPLAPELNPLDPGAFHPKYAYANDALLRQELGRARDLLDEVIRDHPGSFAARQLRFDIAHQARDANVRELAEATRPPEGGAAALEARYFHNLFSAHLLDNDRQVALKALARCVELAPEDASHQFHYSLQLETDGNLEAAEKHRRVAARNMPENIVILDRLCKLLQRRGKWEEADAMSEHVFQLEEIYRSR